jgi:starch synthase
LRYRSFDVHGILNGLDYETWDPTVDPRLAATFSAGNVEGRLQNRRALQQLANLPRRDGIPLVAMISRLDVQKGLDITGHVVHLLLNGYAGDAQLVVLGSGAPQYEDMFRHLASYHGDKMTAILEYNPGLAPLIYGGSDIFLMPSLFEPCGLGQLMAMRYGSVPVVRATGGLADTVQDAVTGFTFYEHTVQDFWNALQRAIYVYRTDGENWASVQYNGMTADFSWQRSAHGYEQLYEWAIARVRGY